MFSIFQKWQSNDFFRQIGRQIFGDVVKYHFQNMAMKKVH